MQRCGIVILAAGASTRMGVAKQSLEFEGRSLLQRATATAMASVCRPIVVVLGSGAEDLKAQLVDLPLTTITNDHWANGMGTSIRAGVAAINSADAVVILLCDQPLVTARAIDQMVETHFRMEQQITAAGYGGTVGTPVVFASALFSELVNLQDHQGGKAILQRHPEMVLSFPLPEAESDIDTQEDFARLRSNSHQL